MLNYVLVELLVWYPNSMIIEQHIVLMSDDIVLVPGDDADD